MANIDQAVSFLTNVWGKQCRTGDFIFLCTRDPQVKNGWKDHAFKYDKALPDKLTKFMKKNNPEKMDLYFCPLPFADNKRDKRYVKRTKLLWQDLDYANPYKFPDNLKPTIFWESSPDRYHGLWELDRVFHNHKIPQIEELNRDLAYQLDADKGGWDLTQVLRIPGTHNHKYDDKPIVELKKSKKKPYQFEDIRSNVVKQGTPLEAAAKMDILQEGDFREVLSKWKKKLPRTLLATLLQKKVPVGERSEMIWHLENSLYEIGLNPEEIFTLIKGSNWNKFRGRADENERLQAELEKITDKASKGPDEIRIVSGDDNSKERRRSGEDEDDGMSLNIESYQDVMSKLNTHPGWLVEGFWARRSHGIVAGEPKTFKSTYTMDLAISVASGKPFLGRYTVQEKGPVIYIQNENADWIIKDRMEKIINHRELVGRVKKKGNTTINVKFPPDLPLYFINQQNYMLNDPIHQEILEELIEEIKPVLIIFDPLYLMFDGDMNSAKDLSPVLAYLLEIKNKFKTGIILIHHYNKSQGSNRGGQKMLGSAVLHGFTESSWYLRRKDNEGDDPFPEGWENMTDKERIESEKDVHSKPSRIILEREFRSAGPGRTIEIELKLAPVGQPGYEPTVYFQDAPESGESKTNSRADKMEMVIYELSERIAGGDKSYTHLDFAKLLKKHKLPNNPKDLKDFRDILATDNQFSFSSEKFGRDGFKMFFK